MHLGRNRLEAERPGGAGRRRITPPKQGYLHAKYQIPGIF